ncbi:MAG TPA: hypothetical protein VI248_11575 [Kineosporiaceae bacterium]
MTVKIPGRGAFRWPRKRAVLGALTAAALVATPLSIRSAAHAESNRRICAYTFKATPRNYSNPLMHISLGLNYKKDGDCPPVNPYKLVQTGYADLDQISPNPVHKWTCEDWGRTHQTYLDPDLGADPCNNMRTDFMYAFFWQDPTTPNPPAPSHQMLSHYLILQ